MRPDHHLFLTGFMGCGKSHWGRRLAEAWQMPFIDLDQRITERAGKSIPELFKLYGEENFRLLERDTLHHIALEPPSIIASGGGTPCFFDNMEWMNAHGWTAYLQTPVATLLERLLPDKAQRPLLANIPVEDLEAFITQKLKERETWYLKAQWIVDATAEDLIQRLTSEVKHPPH